MILTAMNKILEGLLEISKNRFELEIFRRYLRAKLFRLIHGSSRAYSSSNQRDSSGQDYRTRKLLLKSCFMSFL